MMDVDDISCGDFELHWDWSQVALCSRVTHVVLFNVCLNCSVPMTSFLHLMFGIATALVLAMFSKLSKSFYNIQNSSPQSKVNLNLKRSHNFVVVKIGQTNFVKFLKMQGLRISSSWNLLPCI